MLIVQTLSKLMSLMEHDLNFIDLMYHNVVFHKVNAGEEAESQYCVYFLAFSCTFITLSLHWFY